ncbi:MAG: sulfite dehydrogenase [Gammaproteobacteria bacterium]|nr:sulfite dehydrogenase [Gammaproteobacteria bacterium]
MNILDEQPVAGNGLLDRRIFLRGGLAGGAALLTASAAGVERDDWSRAPGAPMDEAGEPSPHEAHVKRTGVRSATGTTGSGVSFSPLEHLDGIITPSRLHFERHHSGIPAVDPGQHRLIIHGLVERPLSFSLEALARYPTVSRINFLECSGNSGSQLAAEPLQRPISHMHGLIAASEWGGVPLAALLEEAGIKPGASWIIADGADSPLMSRSVPLGKAMDDAIVALYQNGERLRPSNGYPMRLFLPGWEGNMSVKWLRAIKVVDQPAMSREETSKYSDLQKDGSSKLFSFPMGVKSLITSPSSQMQLGPQGIYQLSGIAWSGGGRIVRVDISADGGKSWAEAALDEHVLPKCLTRFRSAWRWDGSPAVIMSRAIDEQGNVQPTRSSILADRSPGSGYHYNGIQAWQIDTDGKVSNVYA